VLAVRATLTGDDNLREAEEGLAEPEERSLGQGAADLLQRGLAAGEETGEDHGFPVFRVSAQAREITPEMVGRAAEDKLLPVPEGGEAAALADGSSG
jgi:hypothetical protein